jgi:WXXGXW repeat (2 copies)
VEIEMNLFSRFNFLGTLGLAAAISMAGCHSNQQNAQNQTQDQTQDQNSGDPAVANVVPVAQESAAPSQPYQQSAPSEGNGPSASQAYDQYNQNAAPEDDTADESEYGIEPDETAPQPPPPLPNYDQPPCPGDGYMWTPGYWSYAPAGYYWVPGAWVQAPYQGSLWTPGYWAYANSRYVFYHGYWGPHVGFYGGVNYGFGFVGFGYLGGFWRGGVFNYNRSVNNVNVTVVRNVYNYHIVENNTVRISFNGGRGGIQVRPRMAELAALREAHAAPMATQIAIAQQARNNHANFYSVNRGRPAQAAFSQPVRAVHVRPAVMPVRNLPAAARPAPENARYATEGNRPQEQPNRPEEQMRPEQNRPEQNRMTPPPTQPRQNEPAYHENNERSPARPEAAPTRPESPRPETNHQEPRPESQPHPEARPEPQRTEPQRPAEPNHAAPGHAAPQEHKLAPPPQQHQEHKEEPR